MNSRQRVWIPENQYLQPRPVEKIDVNFPPIRIEGHFHIQLVNAKTQEIEQEVEFPNIITNGALDLIGSNTNNIQGMLLWLAVGTGAVTGGNIPSGSNTALAAEVTPSNTNRTNNNESVGDSFGFSQGSTPYNGYWALTRRRLFTETQGNGNLTEIGFFTANSGGTLVNRATIRDNLGNPVVITKTSSNQLRVNFTYKVFVPVGLTSGTFFIAGNNTDYTMSVIDITNNNAWGDSFSAPYQIGLMSALGSWGPSLGLAAHPSGTMLAYSGSSPNNIVVNTAAYLAPYTNGTYNRTFSGSFDPSIANWGNGIGALAIVIFGASAYQYYMTFNPGIPKTNTQRLQFALNFAWYRSPDSE